MPNTQPPAKNTWNERYAVEEYVYGTEPNSFLAAHANMLHGPVLSLAEGEGRNGVFLATLGLEVHGVDSSDVGLTKARALAKSKGVSMETEVADLAEYSPRENYYGAVISIFAHLPDRIRQRLYPLVASCLKPGGIMLMEAYTEGQLRHHTGGPKDPDMLMSMAKIRDAFPGFEILHLQELEREVVEGSYHTGMASVVQFIGRKQ